MPVLPAADTEFDFEVPVLIVGAGACGLVAALTLKDAGIEALAIERDPVPQGSTALSSGMIPAAGTGRQRDKNIDDSPELMASDLTKKAKGENDPDIVRAVAEISGATIDWLTDEKSIDLQLVEGFLYPGHSALRMHAPPSRTGGELMGALANRAADDGVDIVTDAIVRDLYTEEDGRVTGIAYDRPDGSREKIGCQALVLACNGFGGNTEMVERFIPEIAGAVYCGHVGNKGNAVAWGDALGAATADLGSFQGHGSVAFQHNILITWAVMMDGGIQVNADGKRFSNEHAGYSEQGKIVNAQSGRVAWDIFDGRIHELAMGFEDYRDAEKAGAVHTGDTIEDLAEKLALPADPLRDTLAETQRLAAGEGRDPFGRDFTGQPALAPPFCGIKVTGALFHTQGGLVIDTQARVLRPDGTPLPNLFAGGGAARGLSGKSDYGYLSGNGLLAAVMLGRIAGLSAAKLING